jgi:hypothetical protein
MNTVPVVISAAVEGAIDEVALRRLCNAVGTTLGDVYGRKGKSFVLSQLGGYNYSARFRHWIVLVDLDTDFDCAPDAKTAWLSTPADLMCFRVAVHELEAWLLADRERMASFLGISVDLVPQTPDEIVDPKLALINLARGARSRDVREDIVPDPSSGHTEGPAYTARMIEFIGNHWRPDVAAPNSPSLHRCIVAIRSLVSMPYPARRSE